MLEFLTDANYWREAYVFAVTTHMAGFNMILPEAYRMFAESWAEKKVKK